MLKVNIIVNKESTFSGAMTFYFNDGGVRGIKVDNDLLEFQKIEIKPETYVKGLKST